MASSAANGDAEAKPEPQGCIRLEAGGARPSAVPSGARNARLSRGGGSAGTPLPHVCEVTRPNCSVTRPTAPVTVSADTQSHVLPPGGCCVPGIDGHYSALNENRGPLGRKGKLVEAGSETQEGEDGPEEQDAGRRHGRVAPAVMPPADWLFRQEKRRAARGAWPTEWTPTSGRSHSRVCSFLLCDLK